MKSPFYSFLLLFFTVFCISGPAQALEWRSDIVLNAGTLTYSGPANSVSAGDIIGNNWSATETVGEVFYCGAFITGTFCNSSYMQQGDVIATGKTVVQDGVIYDIYETGVPGIGFILGLKDASAAEWIPLRQGDPVQTYPAPGAGANANQLGWSAKVTFVKTGVPLQTGVYTTNTISAATLTAHLANDMATAHVIISPVTVQVTATGCTISTPDVDIDLGEVDMHTLNSVNSTSELQNFNVGLQCDANIAVHAVITDQTEPGNTSQVVSLTPDSTASGVGVQFLHDGNVVSLGPDDSLNNAPGQFYITSTTQLETLLVPFQAHYIRTGELTPGTANALASITFSYQ